MSDLPADSPALASQTQSDRWPAGPKPPGEGWTQRKIIFLIALALVIHVALIFIFGTRKPIVARVVTDVPHLQLADDADELIALGDPTLFARPNAHDFVTAFWQRPQFVKQRDFHWTEDPRYLLPAPEKFGAAFREFMQTNLMAALPLNFKPEPKLSEPVRAIDDAMPRVTTLQISGELGQRRRLNQIELPSISVNDVIPPSKVQALVDTAGNVASTVLLESSTLAAADQRALELARNLRFAPAPRLMFGEIIFNWHTVPVASTNAP